MVWDAAGRLGHGARRDAASHALWLRVTWPSLRPCGWAGAGLPRRPCSQLLDCSCGGEGQEVGGSGASNGSARSEGDPVGTAPSPGGRAHTEGDSADGRPRCPGASTREGSARLLVCSGSREGRARVPSSWLTHRNHVAAWVRRAALVQQSSAAHRGPPGARQGAGCEMKGKMSTTKCCLSEMLSEDSFVNNYERKKPKTLTLELYFANRRERNHVYCV